MHWTILVLLFLASFVAYILRTNGVHHADVAPGRQAILTLNLRY